MRGELAGGPETAVEICARDPADAALAERLAWLSQLRGAVDDRGLEIDPCLARGIIELAEALKQRVAANRLALQAADMGTSDWDVIGNLHSWDAALRAGERRSRHAQAQVEEERATLAAVMGSMTDGLIVLNGGMILFANARAADLLGVDQASLGPLEGALRAVTDRRLEDPAATTAAWADALARIDQRPSFEATLRGSPPRNLLVQLFLVPAPGGVGGRVGVLLRDVTAERELMRTRDELVSVVSHELRTPLASVLGFAELLRDRVYPESQRRQFLTVIIEEGQRLTALINDFLDLQRPERPERKERGLTAHAVRPLVEQAIRAAGADGTRPIVLRMGDDLPPVYADAGRLQQVLGNLISNARKYSPAGGAVHLSAAALGNDVWISVRDSGLGIPAAAMPHLFEKFYRVDNSDRRSISGTGLGLAICKQIVEAQGGFIRAESAGLGHGSTFSFSLRTALAPAAAPAEPIGPIRRCVDAAA